MNGLAWIASAVLLLPGLAPASRAPPQTIAAARDGTYVVVDDDWITRFAANGDLVWTRHVGGARFDGVLPGEDGSILTTGTVDDVAGFGGAIVTAQHPGARFVARFDASSRLLHVELLPESGPNAAR